MAFKPTKFIKGLLIKEENTNTPKQIEITPGGSANTKTDIVSSQTANRTLTLPDATDTLMGKATTDVMTNKTFDADGTGNSITNIENADIKAGAAIDASKLADGSVSNAEYQQINGLTSPAVGTTQSQTLTNKTIVVADNIVTTAASGNLTSTELNAALSELQGDIDTRATSASLTAHTGASSGVHGVTGDVVGTTDTQTLTNKTLTSPVINTPTGITKADVGLGNVDNTSDATKNAAAVQLTNKDIDGGTASNTSRITLPKNSTSNLTALTRKQGTIVYDTTLNKPYYDDGTTLKAIGAGTAGGSVNLITDGNADDAAASIFVTYNDGIGVTRPVDGTGGSPGNSTSLTSTNPLSGTKSFLLTKVNGSTQGQGFSTTFSVDPAYRAKSLKISMDYIVNSGTFSPGTSTTDSDLIMYIYDITNSQLIEPSNIKFFSNSTTISDKIEATFQTSATGSSYRLIFHCATAQASPYELKVDNVTVSPQVYVYGTPVTDWQPYTPTFVGLGSVSVDSAYWRRVGDSIQIRGRASLGTTNGSTASISLPPGFSVSSTKETITTLYGQFSNQNDTTNVFSLLAAPSSSAVNIARVGNGSLSTLVGTAVGSSGNAIAWYSQPIPIEGLSSSVQMSDAADTRVVAAIIDAGGQSFSTGTSNKFTNLVAAQDTHGTVSSTRWTCRVPGFYRFVQKNSFGSASATFRAVEYYVNGSFFDRAAGFNGTSSTSTDITVSYDLYLTIGDYVEFGAFQNTGVNETVSARISVSRISGPQSIASSEEISLRYTNSSGTTISTGGNQLSFSNKDYDSHGLLIGGNLIKIQSPGRYRLYCKTHIIAPNSGTSTNYMSIYKNNAQITEDVYVASYLNTAFYKFECEDVLDLKAGDEIYVSFNNGFGLSTSQTTFSGHNVLDLTKVK